MGTLLCGVMYAPLPRCQMYPRRLPGDGGRSRGEDLPAGHGFLVTSSPREASRLDTVRAPAPKQPRVLQPVPATVAARAWGPFVFESLSGRVGGLSVRGVGMCVCACVRVCVCVCVCGGGRVE